MVQQGMNEERGWARRYHWLAESVEDFVCEPHAAVEDLAETPPARGRMQQAATDAIEHGGRGGRGQPPGQRRVVRESPDWLLGEIERLTEGPTLFAPARHPVLNLDVNSEAAQGHPPRCPRAESPGLRDVAGAGGVGPATVRSLSLLAEIIFQAPPPAAIRPGDEACTQDTGPRTARQGPDGRRWADYSYAHGGKDGTPFPVDRATYDRNIAVLTDAVRESPARGERQTRSPAPPVEIAPA